MDQTHNILAVFATLFGIAIGSFLNVVIYRVPLRRKFWKLNQRSYCPKCRHKLGTLDLVPVLSYLFLRGRCRYCHKPISPQYIAVELITGAYFLFTFWIYGVSWLALVGIIGGCALLALAFIDGLKRIVLDAISLPAIGAVVFLQILVACTTYANIMDALRYFGLVLLAGVIGGMWFALQWLLSRGKWVGSGDIRIGVLMGVTLGIPALLLALFASYIGGSIWAAGLLVAKKVNMKSRIPFGVFLGAAGMLSFLFSSSVVSWYQRLIGW